MNKTFTKTKPSHEFVKPELLDISKKYAFSFNPSYQPVIGKLNAFKEWYDNHEHMFRDICIASKFNLYVEISATGRFHFHGIITVNNIMNFYIHDVKTLSTNGTCIMKNIESDGIWEEYFLKQQMFIQEYLQKELYGPLVKYKGIIRIYTS